MYQTQNSIIKCSHPKFNLICLNPTCKQKTRKICNNCQIKHAQHEADLVQVTQLQEQLNKVNESSLQQQWFSEQLDSYLQQLSTSIKNLITSIQEKFNKLNMIFQISNFSQLIVKAKNNIQELNDLEIGRLLPLFMSNSIQQYQIVIINKLKQLKEIFALQLFGFNKINKESFKSKISTIDSYFQANRVDFTKLPDEFVEIRGVKINKPQLQLPQNMKYEGEVKEGKPYGRGIMIETNGTIIEGIFQDGHALWGTKFFLTSKNEIALISGKMNKGKVSGHGIQKWANRAAIFEGNMKDDIAEEYGKYVSDNGHCYRGLFKNGLFEGQGVYQYPDGAYYEGCFKNNQKEGSGTYDFPDKSKFSGQWQNGQKHGPSTFLKYSNGSFEYKEIGTYINGIKDGPFKYYDYDDNLIKQIIQSSSIIYRIINFTNGVETSTELMQNLNSGT